MGLIAPVTLVGATVFPYGRCASRADNGANHQARCTCAFWWCTSHFPHEGSDFAYDGGGGIAFGCGLYGRCQTPQHTYAQAYMAFSDGKFLDAQAGAESYGSALLAALAGVNSVSGPGMLDYLIAFSLPKLVFDDALCGQALEFVREMKVVEDIPTVDMARALLEEQHMITAEHTLKHWPEQLYMPNEVIDRQNRENWQKAGSPDLWQRTVAETERLLAAYEPIETETAVLTEMRRIIHAGLVEQTKLPAVPVPVKPKVVASESRKRRRHRRG